MLRIGIKRELLLWKRESSFSIDFWKGLALALVFHSVLFFGLRITHSPNPDALSPLSPFAVEIDLGMPKPLPLPAQAASFPIAQIETPQLLDMPETRLAIEFPEWRQMQIEEPDFSEIEKISYMLLEDLEEEDDDRS